MFLCFSSSVASVVSSFPSSGGVLVGGGCVCCVVGIWCVSCCLCVFVWVGCLVVWLCPRFCGVFRVVLLVCVCSGCSCVLCCVFLLSVLVLVCVALSAFWWVLFSVRGFAPGVFVCSALSPVLFMLLLVVVAGASVLLVVLLVLLVVGLLVLLSPLFCVGSCRFVTIWVGPAPGLTQNATLVGWLCGVSAPGGYASGWLCAIRFVRLVRASCTRSVLFRPSVVRSSCQNFSILPPFALASQLIFPVSGCWFALIMANRFSPFGVVHFSCRWQWACSFSLFMFFVGYVVNVARGFFLLACLQCIHFLLFLYRFSSFSANHQLAPRSGASWRILYVVSLVCGAFMRTLGLVCRPVRFVVCRT